MEGGWRLGIMLKECGSVEQPRTIMGAVRSIVPKKSRNVAATQADRRGQFRPARSQLTIQRAVLWQRPPATEKL